MSRRTPDATVLERQLVIRIIMVLLLSVACARPRVEELPSPAGDGAAEPYLSAGRHGSLLLSWIDSGSVRVARFAEGAWSEPSTVVARDDLFVNWADFPAVVELRDATLLVHWLQKSGAGKYAYDVRFALSRDRGKTWSASRMLHDDATQTEHGFVSLVADASRPVAHAVWLDGRRMASGGDMALRYATISSDGSIASPAELDGRTCECCTTALAATGGGLVAAYRDRSAQEIRDISVVRGGGGGWSAPAPLHRDGWTIAGCPVNGPQLDARGDDVVAAWFTKDRVLVAFSRDGGATFGAPRRIDGGKPTGRVDVVLREDGDAFVTWIDGNAVVGRRVSPEGAPGPIFIIARTTTARASGFPRAARVGGATYVAWTEVEPRKRIRLARVQE